jgi:dephospho-CoA kinase
MIVLGLTGSIGMGKTTTAAMFLDLGVPVHDSDAAVHRLLAKGGACVDAVLRVFPTVSDGQGGIDRSKLGQIVFTDSVRREELESLIHPRVVESEMRFLKTHRESNAPLVVLDIPLLYETGAEKRVDYVLVVTASEDAQRARVLARGLNEDQFCARLAFQMPDKEKRGRADFIVRTDRGMEYTSSAIRNLIAEITEKKDM